MTEAAFQGSRLDYGESRNAHDNLEETIPLPLPLKLILISVFLPEAMSFFVAGLRLTVTRVLFLALAPILFVRFGQKVANGRYAFVMSDVFVPLAALWMFVGPTMTTGFSDAMAHSGPVVLEYLIGYLATRVLLTRDGEALAFVSFLCIVITIVVFDALLDTATGQYFTRDLVSQLTGYQKIGHLADEIRFGLLRAAGPLEHPILFGFVCGFGLLFAVAVPIAQRIFCIAMCAIGSVIAFSSAPVQSVFTGFGLLAYGRWTAGMPARWMALCGASATAVAVVLFAVPSPFGHIIEAVTLDPNTGYYRLYVWNTIGPLVLENPYFGIAQAAIDEIYDGTVDSLWLVLSMLYGMPCAILLGLGMIGACWLPTSGPGSLLTDTESRIGMVLGIVIFLIMLAGFTVHFWGSTWILISLLVGLRANLGERAALNAVDVEAA